MGTPNKARGIMQEFPPYDPSRDFVHREQCGCVVVFFGESLHRSSRMTCCSEHDGRQSFGRDQIHARAKRAINLAKMIGGRV